MTDKQLSPAAQAVWDEYMSTSVRPVAHKQLAAALLAVADQVAPEDFDYWDGRTGDYGAGCETGQNERNAYIRQALLDIANELEKHKTPCEEAYKRVYGFYPETYEDSWSSFQDGYIASQKDYKVGVDEPSMTNCVITGNPPYGYVDWNEWYDEMGSQGILHNLKISSKDYQPTPQTPEQVADGLKEAFREAVKQGVVSSSNKPQTLYDLIAEWWEYLEDTLDMDSSIKDLVNDIEEWLPDEHYSDGEDYDLGFNDCLNKIKGKLK